MIKLLLLTLPLLSLAELSSTCIAAVDQLKPIHASLVIGALERREFVQGLALLLAVPSVEHDQLVQVARALEAKVVWDIPASNETQVEEKLAVLLPKVFSGVWCARALIPPAHC